MLWVKAFHIIFVICWFAGIFYLPRLFVYHALATEEATREHLKIMERKLYNFVTPFALLTLVSGLYLVSQNWDYYKSAAWFHAKVFCVLLLFVYHFYCGKIVKELAISPPQKSHKFFRLLNELPVLLLFAIVILVVVKPF